MAFAPLELICATLRFYGEEWSLNRQSKTTLASTVLRKKKNFLGFTKAMNALLDQFTDNLNKIASPKYQEIDSTLKLIASQARQDNNLINKVLKPYMNNESIGTTRFWDHIQETMIECARKHTRWALLIPEPWRLQKLTEHDPRTLDNYASANINGYNRTEQIPKYSPNSYRPYQPNLNRSYNRSSNHRQPNHNRYYQKPTTRRSTSVLDKVHKAMTVIKPVMQQRQMQPPFSRGHCVFFNAKMECPRNDCNFKHKCPICDNTKNKADHPFITCNAK